MLDSRHCIQYLFVFVLIGNSISNHTTFCSCSLFDLAKTDWNYVNRILDDWRAQNYLIFAVFRLNSNEKDQFNIIEMK